MVFDFSTGKNKISLTTGIVIEKKFYFNIKKGALLIKFDTHRSHLINHDHQEQQKRSDPKHGKETNICTSCFGNLRNCNMSCKSSKHSGTVLTLAKEKVVKLLPRMVLTAVEKTAFKIKRRLSCSILDA